MSKVLYFIGHYDYLISGLLYRSGLTEANVQADFIIQTVKNSAPVVDFAARKAREHSPLGRVALVNDEDFLNHSSESSTQRSIVQGYNRILNGFGMRIEDYDQIFMSFDEWNSFGVYLATKGKLPPVTVFARDGQQLNLDVYHFLDSPGKYHFANLQRRYRTLNAESGYVTEICVMQEGAVGVHHGKPIRGFDPAVRMQSLTHEQFAALCAFFEFDPAQYRRENLLLMVADAYWFESPERKTAYEYARMYQTLLDFAVPAEQPVLFKCHPRYDVEPSLRERCGGMEFVEGYVPAELFAHPDAPAFREIWSAGNPVRKAICSRAEREEVVHNDFVFNWYCYTRLDFIVRFCEKNGYKRLYCRGITSFMLDTYRHYVNPDCPVKLISGGLVHGAHSAVAAKDVDRASFEGELLPLAERGMPVFILNPEHDYHLASQQQLEHVTELMTAVQLRQFALRDKIAASPHESALWLFDRDAEVRKSAAYFSYQTVMPFSGLRLRAGSWPKGSELLAPLPQNHDTKDYIRLRARTSPVVLFGGGKIAYDFACRHEKELNICCVVVDDDDPVDPRLAEKYPVIPFSKAMLSSANYIIICKPFVHNIDKIPPYALARDDLLRRGFTVCRDFTYYRIFDAIETNKPIVLFCGYCELGGMKQVLDLTSAAQQACMLFYHIGRETMLEAPGFDDFVASAKLCDILVHAPLLVNRGVLDVDVLQMISPETKTVFVPQISFRGYAPYKISNFLRRNFSIMLFGTVYYPFLYQIRNVNLMVLRGRTNQEILAELKRPDLFSEEEIQKNLEDALRILEIMDAKSDIPIFDFIRDNYQKALLFKDCIHTNDIVFFEYARRFSRYLGHEEWISEIDAAEVRCRENGAYFQVASEEPILPCVAKALGLEFATPDRLYMEKVTEERVRMRTFDEWYNDYCNYFRSVITVNRTLDRDYQTREVTIYRNEEDY